jgi:hypothetical protein
VDRVEDGVDLPQDHAVRETQDAEAFEAKIGIPAGIVGRASLEAVLLTVDLDDEPGRQAAEIRHVGAEGDLPAEMRAVHRQAVAQVPPEPLLRLGERAPQRLRVRGRSGRGCSPGLLVPGHV